MSLDLERIYKLLPAIYRTRDAELGSPLRALLAVVTGQVAALEEDIAQLYDDQFIETCADWVVPYIGDLIGYHALHGVTPTISSPRSEVANTIGLRRRKGTVAALEELARDVTGWPAHVLEFFQLLSTTQYLNHLRPGNIQCPDLRAVKLLQRIGGAFEQTTHSLDVRLIAGGRGRYNIPNIGVFLWRLEALQLSQSTARNIAAAGAGCYTFDPLGIDVPLFNPSRPPDTDFTRLTDPSQVSAAAPRRPLYAELEALRRSIADKTATPTPAWFADPILVAVSVAAGPQAANADPIPPEKTLICDLSTWQVPAAVKSYQPPWLAGQTAQPAIVDLPIAVAIDPALGRITFPSGQLPAGAEVRVNFFHGFSAEMGGGEYARKSIAADFTVGRGGDLPAAALTAAGKAAYVIAIDTSATYPLDVTIDLQAGQNLTLRGGDGCRPVIDGSITVNAADGAELTFDGLLISGPLAVVGSNAMNLTLIDCTLAPWRRLTANKPAALPAPSIAWIAGGECQLLIQNSICGRLSLGAGISLELVASIVDALDDAAGAFCDPATEPAGTLSVSRSTIIGATRFREITLAEDSIFTGLVTSERRQAGCVRFCYLPPASQTPRRYRCQPEMAASDAIDAAKKTNPAIDGVTQGNIRANEVLRVQPGFTSRDWGRPGYMQLLTSSPAEITTGSEDESEMGVFSTLYQSQRISNLYIRLAEYLRFGLEAGILLET